MRGLVLVGVAVALVASRCQSEPPGTTEPSGVAGMPDRPPAPEVAPSPTPLPQAPVGVMQAQPQASRPGRADEAIPPPGRDLVLADPQIRFCLAEEVRLAAGQRSIDPRQARQVDAFNALVVRYNGRCGSFRYLGDAVARMRADVEGRRADLEEEGRSRLTRIRSAAAVSDGGIAQEPFILLVQTRLHALGHAVGDIDGIAGPRLRDAIAEYQRRFRLKETGVPTVELLDHLDGTATAVARR